MRLKEDRKQNYSFRSILSFFTYSLAMFSSRFIYSFLYLFLIILRSYTTIIPYSLQVCVLFRTSFSLGHHITV